MTVQIGILLDLLEADGGAATEAIVRRAFDEVAASPVGDSLPDVELVTRMAEGHPSGTPEAVADALAEHVRSGVLAVIGPAISDNALVCVPVANDARLPCINWTGSEQARSEWMFHYQVGSLEDEPFVLAEHLESRGLQRVALVRENSFIGRQYASFFNDAVAMHGLELLGTVDLDVAGNEGEAAVRALGELSPDAVVYFGLGMSARGLSTAMRGHSWPVVTNSALMFGHRNPDWRADFEGWTYIDVYDEENTVRQRLQEELGLAGDEPIPATLYDMGTLVALGLVHAPMHSRDGVRRGLEHVKRVPSALGSPGTVMGFGRWKHCALEGGYLVLRQWRGGKSVRFAG